MRSLALLLPFLVVEVLQASLFTTFSLNVLRPSRSPRRVEEEDITSKLDQFGDIPQLSNAFKALEQASSIAVIQLANNTTLVGLLADHAQKLLVPIGAQQLKVLDYPNMHILLTGFAGDGRSVLRHARQVVVNHTMALDCAPSPRKVAKCLGEYMHSFLSQNMRPLACHAFIIHTTGRKACSIFEVDPSGSMQQVIAGVAGRGAEQGRQLLEQRLGQPLGQPLDEAEARRLIEEMWKDQLADAPIDQKKQLKFFVLTGSAITKGAKGRAEEEEAEKEKEAK